LGFTIVPPGSLRHHTGLGLFFGPKGLASAVAKKITPGVPHFGGAGISRLLAPTLNAPVYSFVRSAHFAIGLAFPSPFLTIYKPSNRFGKFMFSQVDFHGHIRRTHQWSVSRSKGKISGAGGAAEILKINHGTLRARMKKLGISFRRSIRSKKS
jgi:hypothetical protein